MSDTPVISAADVAKSLRETASTLTREADTAQAVIENEEKSAEDAVAQQKLAEKSASDEKFSTVNQRIEKKAVSTTDRAVLAIKRNLDVYKTAEIGSMEKVEALSKITDTVMRLPKKPVLDTILAFFIENKDEDFLAPINALQNTTVLEKSINIRVRLLYEIMSSIARGTASRRTINLDMISNIFASDDILNWVAVKISKKRK